MIPKNQHARLLLAKNTAGAIAFCEACDVVEMEIGAISLRIDAESLEALSQLLKDANTRLNYYRLESANAEKKQAHQQAPDLSVH
ncbi:MAG TPA: hypothetical protein VK952_01130 [Methylotenera sp.]|nr:hypothetical protein [Methylotenera sp.]